MKTVLITGARAPAALELVRLFSRAGARVLTCDSVRFALAASSRASSRYFRHRSPSAYPEEFVDQLRDIVRRECVDLIVPSCEEAFYVAKYGDTLRQECTVFLPEHQAMQTAHHKGDFIKLAQTLGLRVPRTQVVSHSLQAASLGEAWGSEIVLKPVHSRFASRVQLSPSPIVIERLGISAARPWVAQERIEGTHFSSYSLARDGALRAHTAYGCEERVGNGATVRFQQLMKPLLSEKIETWVQTYVRATQWTGQIAFDFIANQKALYAIECNPRATSGVHLFSNGPAFAAAFFEAQGPMLRPDPNSIRHLALPRLVLNLRKAHQARWMDFLRSEDVVGAWRDPVPGLFQLLSAAEVAWHAARGGLSLLEATTWDIEYNGASL